MMSYKHGPSQTKKCINHAQGYRLKHQSKGVSSQNPEILAISPEPQDIEAMDIPRIGPPFLWMGMKPCMDVEPSPWTRDDDLSSRVEEYDDR